MILKRGVPLVTLCVYVCVCTDICLFNVLPYHSPPIFESCFRLFLKLTDWSEFLTSEYHCISVTLALKSWCNYHDLLLMWIWRYLFRFTCMLIKYFSQENSKSSVSFWEQIWADCNTPLFFISLSTHPTTHIHTQIQTHTCVCMPMCMCMCVYVSMYILIHVTSDEKCKEG